MNAVLATMTGDTFQFQLIMSLFAKALNIEHQHVPHALLLVHKSHQSLNDASKEYQCQAWPLTGNTQAFIQAVISLVPIP